MRFTVNSELQCCMTDYFALQIIWTTYLKESNSNCEGYNWYAYDLGNYKYDELKALQGVGAITNNSIK